MKVVLLDIDGVVCNPQEPISDEMRKAIEEHIVYFVTGNSYTRAVDLVGNYPIFCNMADELRLDGKLLWRDIVTPPLPYIEFGRPPANCSIDWRSPKFVNYSQVGRYATSEERLAHDNSWRSQFITYIKIFHEGVEAVLGGEVSVDIYSKGADKSRAGLWLNEQGYTFTFIGDRTDYGGNDYPLVEYCEANPQNRWFKSNSPNHTIELLASI